MTFITLINFNQEILITVLHFSAKKWVQYEERIGREVICKTSLEFKVRAGLGDWLRTSAGVRPAIKTTTSGGKLISHTTCVGDREGSSTQLRGSSPRDLTGDDRTNMSRLSPSANCFPPIESSSLSWRNPTESFRRIVRDASPLTWKRKICPVESERVDQRGAIVNYISDRVGECWLFKFDRR